MILTRALDAVYIRLDLYGPDGRPSNAKVLSTTGFYVALPGVLAWGGLEAANNGVGFEVVIALGIVLGLAFGLDGFKAALKVRSADPAPGAMPYAFSVPAPHAWPDAHAVEATAGELLPPVAQSRPEAP